MNKKQLYECITERKTSPQFASHPDNIKKEQLAVSLWLVNLFQSKQST